MIRLFHNIFSVCLLIGLFFPSFGFALHAANKTVPVNPDKVLILYDSNYEWGWAGYLNSVFLANLIGHFEHKTYTLLPIEKYTKGKLATYGTTFYLGTRYNHPLPKDFINDVLNTTQTIVWFRYNIWQLIQAHPHFSTTYGFTFDGLDQSGYDEIIYKNTSLSKSQLDPELGHVNINNPTLAVVPAIAKQTRTAKTIPYIVHSANLWYVADTPFSYLSENDRYLVLADLLYDMLNVKGVEQKRAILRLEDIDAVYDPTILRNIADYLHSQHVPFAIAVIPYYNDPLGYFTNGVPKFIKLSDAPAFIATLKYMESKGGTIILHGYTHQYSTIPNGYSGVSADDYEFFRVMNDPQNISKNLFQAVAEDSTAWVEERVTLALSQLNDEDLSAAIWETPHYTASKIDNQYFAKKFTASIGRIFYFDNVDTRHTAQQFYPYVIQKDTYGQKVIPENLGYISPVASFNMPIRTVNDVVDTAKKNLVVRDAWASMYYHPYLGLSYLEQLVPAIKALGYEFVPVSPHLN